MTWRLFPNLASDNMPDVVSANKMVVVADTTPLRYLIVMGRQGLFPAACELGADLVVMDDAQGTREAAVLGLGVIGTIGLLRLAVERGLADASEVIEDLGRTNFYFSADLLRNAFAEWL